MLSGFNTDDKLGREIKLKLSEDLLNLYSITEDNLDIADYIIILIVNGKPSNDIVNEIKEFLDVIIDKSFIDNIRIEINKIVEKNNENKLVLEDNNKSLILKVNNIEEIDEDNDMDYAKDDQTDDIIQKNNTVNHDLNIIMKNISNKFSHGSGIKKNNTTKKNQFTLKNRSEKFKILQKTLGNNIQGVTKIMKFESKTKKKRCPDFPLCEKKNCEFSHPTKKCFAYPNCLNPVGTCNYLHPDQDQDLIAEIEISRKKIQEKKQNDLFILQCTCKFGLLCTKDACPFAHPTPANKDIKITTLDWCEFGKNCSDPECVKSHPPPPTAKPTILTYSNSKIYEQCKFGVSCTKLKCSRRHAMSNVPCRDESNCKRIDCFFTHPLNEACRFSDKCQNKYCMFQHPEGRQVFYNTWSKTSEK